MSCKRDWLTLEALRESPKGKLKYDYDWDLEDLLEKSQDSCKLSAYAAWVLDTLVQKTDLDLSTPSSPSSNDVGLSINLSPTAQLASLTLSSDLPNNTANPVKENGQDSEKSVEQAESSALLQSAKISEVEGSIHVYEEIQRTEVQEKLDQRLEMFEQVGKSLADKAMEQFKRFEEKMELKQRQERHQLQEQLDKGTKEVLGKQEKLKEEHRRRAKLLNLKLREAEQQRQQELERIRQEEGRERLRRLCSLQQEALQLIQQMEADNKLTGTLGLDFSAYSHRGNQICGTLSSVVRSSSERGFPSPDDVITGERLVQELRELVSSRQLEIAAAEERKKAEVASARQKQEEYEKQQKIMAQTPAPAQDQKQIRREGLQEEAASSTMLRYQQLQGILDQCLNSFDQLSTSNDAQVKKIKASLQKAITIPVSQLSTKAGSQLKENFDKINNLLLGKPSTTRGTVVSVTQHPQGLDFAYYKLAEKFVRQAEEEVSSHHDAAFPLAMVISGIWELHPKVGDLFLAHLHRKCPYAVPFNPMYKKGLPLDEFKRMLGYLVVDSKMEAQDNFLKRMSGMIRLYAAILQSQWPYGNKQGSPPHGLNHGWHWLAQMVNMEPMEDVTATLLYDFLEVCGNALMKLYKAQFWKLLLLIKDEYFPRIEKITSPGQMGSVTRLKQFLESSLHRKQIPVPKGYLQPSFWRS